MYKKTTQVPNLILDDYLPILSKGELKILLVIIRQTNGWINQHTGKRKTHDRISNSQFKSKTGLSAISISQSLQKLVERGLIEVYDQSREILPTSLSRKGNPSLFYSLRLAQISTSTSAKNPLSPAQKSAMYKTNYTKLNKTKLREGSVQSIGEVIAKLATLDKNRLLKTEYPSSDLMEFK